MKKLIKLVIPVLSFLLNSTAISAQTGPPWTGSNFGYNYIFRAVDFPSNQNDIGFACGESLTYQGDGIVVKTTDGGANWIQMWTGSGRGVEGACFTDVSTGYIAGWPKLGQGWSGFAKTTDGGATWTSLPVTNDIYFFTDVVFKDSDHGVLVGQTNFGAGVWATSNGGTTWSPGTGFVAIPQHVCHVSGDTYFLVDNDGHIQKSTNGGLTWSTVWSAPGSVYILGIDHFGDNIIMACGDNGLVAVSNDGGTTWNAQTVGVDIWHDFGWESANHVFVCGTPALVYESMDGGVTWQNANPQGAGSSALYECTFTADYHGFICGSQGVELKRNPGCGAGFTASSTSTCTGDSVAFTDLSWGSITQYSWVFEGGSPSTSSDPNPIIAYDSPGSYDVSLTVSNPWWTDTKTETNYITVTQAPVTPVITVNGYTLTSNSASGNQWYLNGYPLPGATGETWDATASGVYWDVVTAGNCASDTSNNIYLVMTGIPGYTKSGLTIAPMPNRGRFSVSWTDAGASEYELEVFNSLGMVVCRQSNAVAAGNNPLSVDLGNVPAGIYFLVVSHNGHRESQSFVVE